MDQPEDPVILYCRLSASVLYVNDEVAYDALCDELDVLWASMSHEDQRRCEELILGHKA